MLCMTTLIPQMEVIPANHGDTRKEGITAGDQVITLAWVGMVEVIRVAVVVTNEVEASLMDFWVGLEVVAMEILAF